MCIAAVAVYASHMAPGNSLIDLKNLQFYIKSLRINKYMLKNDFYVEFLSDYVKKLSKKNFFDLKKCVFIYLNNKKIAVIVIKMKSKVIREPIINSKAKVDMAAVVLADPFRPNLRPKEATRKLFEPSICLPVSRLFLLTLLCWCIRLSYIFSLFKVLLTTSFESLSFVVDLFL